MAICTGNVTIQGSSFNFGTSSNGIVSTLDTDVSIIDSSFKKFTSIGASILNFNTYNVNTFYIVNSNFSGNTGRTYGGVVYAKNSNLDYVTLGGTIINANFNGNTANWGGAICSLSIPINITNSLFIGNTATSHGGVIYFEGSTMNIENTTFIQSSPSSLSAATLDSSELLGQEIYAYYSTLSINSSKFDNEFSETIYCLQASIFIDFDTIFNPSSLTCSYSCAFVLNKTKEMCMSGSTSTSGTSTGTGTGIGSTTQNTIITISSTSTHSSTSTTGSNSSKLNIHSSINYI